jgi:hypothetical protein
MKKNSNKFIDGICYRLNLVLGAPNFKLLQIMCGLHRGMPRASNKNDPPIFYHDLRQIAYSMWTMNIDSWLLIQLSPNIV